MYMHMYMYMYMYMYMAASQNRGAFVSYWAGPPPKNPGPASRFTACASLARLFGGTGGTMLNDVELSKRKDKSAIS